MGEDSPKLSSAKISRYTVFMDSLSATEAQFGAVIRIRLDTISGPIRKLIGLAETRLQCYVEEASSLPSSAVEEKTVMEDELRVEEVANCSY